VVAAVSIAPKAGTSANQLQSGLSTKIQETMVSRVTALVLATPNLNTALVSGKTLNDIQFISTPASVQKPNASTTMTPGISVRSPNPAPSTTSTSTTMEGTLALPSGSSGAQAARTIGSTRPTSPTASTDAKAPTIVLILAGICGLGLLTAVVMAGLSCLLAVTRKMSSTKCSQRETSSEDRAAVAVIPSLLETTGGAAAAAKATVGATVDVEKAEESLM